MMRAATLFPVAERGGADAEGVGEFGLAELRPRADTVVGEATEAKGISFDGLYSGGDVFSDRVGRRMGEVVERPEQVGLPGGG